MNSYKSTTYASKKKSDFFFIFIKIPETDSFYDSTRETYKKVRPTNNDIIIESVLLKLINQLKFCYFSASRGSTSKRKDFPSWGAGG